jgi:TrkA-N domain
MLLILGDAGALPDALILRLAGAGIEAERRSVSTDAAVRDLLLETRWTAVAVVTRDDILSLRLTLLSAHVRPDLPLWATIFDRTVAHQIREAVPEANIVSTAEMVATAIAAQCDALLPSRRPRWTHGVRWVDDALRLLVLTGAGLVLALLVQIVIGIVGLHLNGVDAVFFSVRTLATIADAPQANTAPVWFKLVATADTLATIGLLALFTAALVRRLSRPRLTTLVGSRSCPARGHVLLVGLGQVGFRLAETLIAHGRAVIVVESDASASYVRLARQARIPVAIGRGDDRGTLELVGVRHCAVVAAVTSDDLVNVEVGLAAKELSPEVPLVLRLGDGDVAAESDSLLHLGRICDAHGVASARLTESMAAQLHPPASGR